MATASAIDWPALEKALRQVLPPRAVVSKAQELLSYDWDGLTMDRHQPPLAVLPDSTEQVAAVFTAAQFHHICVKRAEGGTKEIAGGGHLLRGLLCCSAHCVVATQHQTQDQQLPNIFIITAICSDYILYTQNISSAKKTSLVLLRKISSKILKTKMNALRTHWHIM